MLIILSLATWVASVATAFLGLGGFLLSSKDEKALPRPVYLTLAAVFTTVSFSLFYSLGGPRQW